MGVFISKFKTYFLLISTCLFWVSVAIFIKTEVISEGVSRNPLCGATQVGKFQNDNKTYIAKIYERNCSSLAEMEVILIMHDVDKDTNLENLFVTSEEYESLSFGWEDNRKFVITGVELENLSRYHSYANRARVEIKN